MNNNNVITKDEIEVDLLSIAKLLINRAWIIIISMIVVGAIMFSYALFFITPTYKASAKMYVNNTSFDVGSVSISNSELVAAKSLLEVYVIILKTRITLERVIEEAGLDYSYEHLYGMVSASSVNETEIFEISVTSTSPSEAELIVDKIVEVLPERISDVVEGSSVSLVDHAVLPTSKSAPNCTKYAMTGFLIGAIISCGAIIISQLFDNTVSGEEYLTQKYDIPVLVVVPDAHDHRKHSYNKYHNYYYAGSSSKTTGADDKNV